MSVSTEDYIPFDYLRYVQEILPAIEQATLGNQQPLRALLASATHFSACPCHNYPLPLPLDKQWDKVWRLMVVPHWVATPNLSQILEDAP